MKFMITWRVHPEKRRQVLETWVGLSDAQRSDAGPGVKLLGRWHNSAEYTGVAIVETNDAAAMFAYLAQWNTVMDMDVGPVLDDAESVAMGRVVLG